jgi:uncharacterized protein
LVLDPLILLALAGVGLAAGFVDAVAGGGGLISVPVLLSLGFPPIAALATTKLQSAIGTAVAVVTYWRGGFVSLKRLIPGVVATYAGGLLGAFAVTSIDTTALQVAIPVLLIGVAGYFLFAPKLTDEDRHTRLSFPIFVPIVGFVLGFYDGVFGPGTGSFFTMAFVTLFGLGVTRAAANTKVLNEISNLAALTIFIPAGAVVWPAALAMGFGQIAGGYIGARAGIRFGAKLIRPLVVVISMALAIRLLFFR